MSEAYCIGCPRREAQDAEIERLRHNEAFHVERAAAQDVEIERLGAALRAIEGGNEHWSAAIARAALEGEP